VDSELAEDFDVEAPGLVGQGWLGYQLVDDEQRWNLPMPPEVADELLMAARTEVTTVRPVDTWREVEYLRRGGVLACPPQPQDPRTAGMCQYRHRPPDQADGRIRMPARSSPDFGLTAGDYRRHRAGFPPELMRRLRGFGIGTPGQRVLDLGTGTGSLARLFALSGAEVTGIDPAAALLEQARALDQEAGVRADYLVGTAEETGLPDARFDVVSAGQCWHWFDAPKAAAEVRRCLRPGGHVVITHFDWLPLPGNVVEATETLIQRFNPKWTLGGGTGMYPRWLTDLATAGFTEIETFSFDLDVPYTPEGWRGRIRASAGVGASLTPERVTAFDDELEAILRQDFFGDVLKIPHRTWAVVAVSPLAA
jgi:SAM-dependent methyltransferase